jgi:Protein kinase domain
MSQGIEPARICSLCGKPIEGSLTGWIFNRTNCGCPTPVPKEVGVKSSDNPSRSSKPFSSGEYGSYEANRGDAQADDLQPGQIIADRYEVLSLIGRGTMGSVYRVQQLHLQKKVALKVLNKVAGTGSNNQRRFQNEAVAAGRLDHPNLVRALDFGFLENEQPYIVMELVQGETLADYLNREGRLGPEAAAELFIPLCLALSYAHQENIIHRDIKPANILLIPASSGKLPVPKLVDFGIAKLIVGGEAGTLTQAGEIFGTPFYMSPEQCEGSLVDKTSDIYSLGCVLYESLTGTPPFIGTPMQALVQHREKMPASLKDASLGINFPKGIENITFKMLAKVPKERYQDCLEVAEDLATFLRGERVSAANPGATVGGAKVLRKTAVRAVVACAAVVSVVLLGANIAFQSHNNPVTVADRKSRDKKLPVVSLGVAKKSKNDAEETDPLAIQRRHLANIQSQEYFSRVVQTPVPARIYDFGDLDLGSIGWDEPGPNGAQRRIIKKARGTVLIPLGARYIIWEVDFAVLCDNPRLLYRFADDELAELRLRYGGRERIEDRIPARVFDDTLTFASHLKSLQSLDMASAPVSINGLNNLHIDDLIELSWLNVCDTKIDGGALARHPKLLKRLEVLIAGNIINGRQILRPLEHSDRLGNLTLYGADMTDADLVSVATMHKLRNLDIRMNPAITNDGVKSLLGLHDLLFLRLPSSITPDIVSSLKPLSKLKLLEIEGDSWSPEDIAKARKKLPTVEIRGSQLRNEQLWQKRAQIAKKAREALGP